MIIQLKYHTQPHKDRKIPYEWSSFNDRKSTIWKFHWRIPKSGCFNTQSVIILDDLGVPSGKLIVCFKKNEWKWHVGFVDLPIKVVIFQRHPPYQGRLNHHVHHISIIFFPTIGFPHRVWLKLHISIIFLIETPYFKEYLNQWIFQSFPSHVWLKLHWPRPHLRFSPWSARRRPKPRRGPPPDELFFSDTNVCCED